MRIRTDLLLLVLTLTFSLAAPLNAQTGGPKDSEWLAAAFDASQGPQRALVTFSDPASDPLGDIERSRPSSSEREARLAGLATVYAALKARAALSSIAGITLLEDYPNLPMAVYLVSDRAALTAMVQNSLIQSIRPLEKREANAGTNLALIRQPLASALHQFGSSTSVAVLDTGTDYTRAEFGSCTSPGQPENCKVVYYSHIAPDDGQLDAIGHGTNVAAIVLQVAPDTRIVALNVFNGPTADDQDVIRALNWVFENYARYHIVSANMSLGSNRSSSPCQSQYAVPFQHLLAARVIPVASSGNDADPTKINSPACTPGALSVGAVYDTNLGAKNWEPCSDAASKADQIACFSNSASFLSILAPGVYIDAGGRTMSGTSQAAPHVSGAIALMRSAAPNATVAQLVSALRSSDVKITDPRNGVVTPRLDLPQALSPFIPGGIDFDSPSYSASGDQSSITIRLVRRFGHVGALSIRYQTADNTAHQNVDYKPASGTVRWQDGDTDTKTIEISLLRNSALTCGTMFLIQISPDDADSVTLRPYATVSIADPNTQSELQLVQRTPDIHHGAASVDVDTIAANPSLLFAGGGHRISSFSIDPTTGKLSNGAYVDVPVFNSTLSRLIISKGGGTLFADGGGPMPLVADIQSDGHLNIHPRLNPPFGLSYSSIAADPSGLFLYAQTSDGRLATFDISGNGDPRLLRFDEYGPSGNRTVIDITVSSDGSTLVANAVIGDEFVLITFARDTNTGTLTRIDELHFPDGLGNEAGGYVGYGNGPFWYHRRANRLYTLKLSDDHRFSIIDVQTIDAAGGSRQSLSVATDRERLVVSDSQGFLSYKIDRETGKLTRMLGEFNITKCLVGAPSAVPLVVQFYPIRAGFSEILFGSWKNPDFVDDGEIGVFNVPLAP